MRQTKKDEELQSRREFFKSAAKGALPIFAISMLGSTVLSSCDKDDKTVEPSGGCKNT